MLVSDEGLRLFASSYYCWCCIIVFFFDLEIGVSAVSYGMEKATEKHVLFSSLDNLRPSRACGMEMGFNEDPFMVEISWEADTLYCDAPVTVSRPWSQLNHSSLCVYVDSVCVCARARKCLYVYVHVHVYVCVCVCMYVYVYRYVYVYVHVYVYVYVYMYMYVYVHAYFLFMCVCVYVYMYVYVYV